MRIFRANKTILIPLTCLVIGWLFAVMAAIRWIDRQTMDDFPDQTTLKVTRFFWGISPAINRNSDAFRAIKFSWLTLNRGNKLVRIKKGESLYSLLGQEQRFLQKYYLNNFNNLSLESKAKIMIQLLLYLNRFELFVVYEDKAAEKNLQVMLEQTAPLISTLSLNDQEGWHRENMIRAQTKGNEEQFTFHKNSYIKIQQKIHPLRNSDFALGVVNFYEGNINCLKNNPTLAEKNLRDAALIFKMNYEEAVIFLYQNLNILIGGMSSIKSPACRELINDFSKSI
jgi:hypothetical protein